jgi:hypothetical protein
MARQLSLLEAPPAWRIDEATREAGRRGVAEARATLAKAVAARRAAEAKGSPEHPSHGRTAA